MKTALDKSYFLIIDYNLEATNLEITNPSFYVELEELKIKVLKLLYEACIK